MAWQTAWTMVPNDAYYDSAVRNYRNIIPADSSSYNGTKIRITVTAHATGAATLDGSSIGQMTTADDMDNPADGTFKRITWVDAGGGNGITCPAGTSVVSDEITFNFDKTKRYGVHFYMANRWYWVLLSPGGSGSYYDTGASDDTLTQTVSFTLATYATAAITKLEVYVEEGGEFVYSGDIGLVLVPSALYSGKKVIYATGQQVSREEKELLLIGAKEPVFIGRKKPVFISRK